MARLRILTKLGGLATLAAIGLFASPAMAIFSWLDPASHPRVILVADQSLAGYMDEHPEWFTRDFLVAGFYVSDVEYGHNDDARRKYGYIRDKLWRSNIDLGTYVSGTTVIPELALTKFPSDSVSIEDLPIWMRYSETWMRDPLQKVVDFKDARSMTAFQGGIENLWRHAPGALRFVDNAAIHPFVARGQSWEAYCNNMAALRAHEETRRSHVIFNVFARPWEMNELEIFELANAVAGDGNNAISFPIPWSRKLKDNQAANFWIVTHYIELLNRGIVIILIPSDEADTDELSGWLSTWRRPWDRVYIASPYSEPPPYPKQ